MYVSLVDSYLEHSIEPGRTVSIKYINEYFIYVFEGLVIKVDSSYPGYAAVSIVTAQEDINSRLSPRYDVHLSANIKPVWDNDSYPATVTDISFGGTAFICSNRFDHNEELDIEINLYLDKSIKAKGKIIRNSIKNKVTEYSMQFSGMDESSYKTLSLFFSKHEEDKGALYNHYLSDIKGKSAHFCR